MFEAFNAQAKSVGDLLGDNQPAKIVVPRFQRGYMWQKKHVETFWNDIRAHKKDRLLKGGPDKYFFGPIVLRQPSSDVIFLLDGQQRLATVTILLSVLRDEAKKIGTTEAQIFAADIQAHLISKEDVGYSLELGDLDKPTSYRPFSPRRPRTRNRASGRTATFGRRVSFSQQPCRKPSQKRARPTPWQSSRRSGR